MFTPKMRKRFPPENKCPSCTETNPFLPAGFSSHELMFVAEGDASSHGRTKGNSSPAEHWTTKGAKNAKRRSGEKLRKTFAPFVVKFRRMNVRCWLFVFIVGWNVGARAQFSAAWLQDEKYWGDGKAEFNIYDAQEVRYGQARPSEVIHILVREPFSERDLVKAEPNTHAGTYPVIKLNQVLHIPTGIYVYQQMHSAFWRCDTGELVKATLTSNDSCGNTYKEFRAFGGLRGLTSHGWNYEWRTYWEGTSRGEEAVTAPRGAIFYDELPMRVRTIDFSNGAGAFATAIAPTVIGSKRDQIAFAGASVDWAVRSDVIAVRVSIGADPDSAKHDDFQLDPKPPHLVREWKKSDGGSLKLRRSLKIDYWNYNKVGDLERALQTP
jgi:hypothetical protein